MSDEPFLSRWSRKKRDAASTARPEGPVPAQPAPASLGPGAGTSLPSQPPQPQAPSVEKAALPPVESLTPESDFAPFMRPDIEDSIKRKAMKTLFADPRFNVMDGLDVYIDDYSKPDPLPDGWLEKLNQVARLGNSGTVEPGAGGESREVSEKVDRTAFDAPVEEHAGPENSSDTVAETPPLPEVK